MSDGKQPQKPPRLVTREQLLEEYIQYVKQLPPKVKAQMRQGLDRYLFRKS